MSVGDGTGEAEVGSPPIEPEPEELFVIGPSVDEVGEAPVGVDDVGEGAESFFSRSQ